MAINGYPTAKTVINRAAVQCGLAALDYPLASTDPNFVLLVELLNTLGEDLNQGYIWPQMLRSHSLTTSAVFTDFSLPLDFLRMVPQTGWNLTSATELAGPMSPQEWQCAVAGSLAPTVRVNFRLRPVPNGGSGNEHEMGISVLPEQGSGQEISFEYQSRSWVLEDAGDLKASVTADDDQTLFPEALLVRGLVYLYKDARGFEASSAQRSFAQVLSAAKANVNSAQVLNIANRSGVVLIGDRNLPTNFGGS